MTTALQIHVVILEKKGGHPPAAFPMYFLLISLQFVYSYSCSMAIKCTKI